MPASRVEYDLKIQRHKVLKAAEEHSWGRRAAPNFDYFDRVAADKSMTEVQVFYFDNGNVNSARIIDHTNNTSVPAVQPNLLLTVLNWLTAGG
jgi:hypothetical protein